MRRGMPRCNVVFGRPMPLDLSRGEAKASGVGLADERVELTRLCGHRRPDRGPLPGAGAVMCVYRKPGHGCGMLPGGVSVRRCPCFVFK